MKTKAIVIPFEGLLMVAVIWACTRGPLVLLTSRAAKITASSSVRSLFASVPTTQTASKTLSSQSKQHVTDVIGKLPLSFEANQGQTDARVKFLSRGYGFSLFLTSDEAVLALRPSSRDVSERKTTIFRSQKLWLLSAIK